MNIIAKNITSEVPTAVWLAALIKTYLNFEFDNTQRYWLTQREIQDIACQLCHKNIDTARISQWCNGDHANNNYNYLRANGALRRMTKVNEFNGKKEIPRELPIDAAIFENNSIKLIDLLDWYNKVYCSLSVDTYQLKENKPTIKKDTSALKKPVNFYTSDSTAKITIGTDISKRTINAVKDAWEVFSRKVGGGIIQINKEASMQLHFAYVLQQVTPLVIFQDDEKINLELETAVSDGERLRETDIMMIVDKGGEIFKIALELKCYKKIASSGGNRGATDIFMKDIYQDLHLLESYCKHGGVDYGIALIMTDHSYFVSSDRKDGKCWDYDTTHGTLIGSKTYNTPIGGKPINIKLDNQYHFDWKNNGDYYFALLEKSQVCETPEDNEGADNLKYINAGMTAFDVEETADDYDCISELFLEESSRGPTGWHSKGFSEASDYSGESTFDDVRKELEKL